MFGESHFFEEQLRRFAVPASANYVHVLLHSTNGNDRQEEGAEQCPGPFEIGERLWVCRMPNELRDAVYKACEPPGEPYEAAHRQYGQLYTVALFMGQMLPGTLSSWDAYGYITKFVTFSQLLHPTSIGFGNTAILRFDSDGNFKQASPGPCRGMTEHAAVIPPMRNWLSKTECETAKALFHKTNLDGLPARVARANWSVQHAAYQFFFEVRMMLVASALDSLVHIENEGSGIGTGRQFKERVPMIAVDLGIALTPNDAEALWKHRSDVVHGRDPWLSVRNPDDPKWQVSPLHRDDPFVQRYLMAEEILRRTVLKCLTNQQFADRFASDDTVKAAYPLSPHPQSGRSAKTSRTRR
jgi:hypothetical protein